MSAVSDWLWFALSYIPFRFTERIGLKQHCLNVFFFFLRLRQKLREKYSRHVADLKAYYESEIQTLRDKLNLPQDLETNNRALTERLVFIVDITLYFNESKVIKPAYQHFYLCLLNIDNIQFNHYYYLLQ